MTRAEHIAELLRREPAWTLVCDSLFGGASVTGPIVVRGATGKRYPFHVRIDVPRGFPDRDAHPDTWILESPFARDCGGAHVDDDGNVCIELHRAHEIDYATVRLVGFFDQVVIHLDRLRIHAFTKRYPGPVYGHGDAGVREFLREVHANVTRDLPPALVNAAWPGVALPPNRQWCGCGSGRRFGECHKAAVKEARKRMAASGPPPHRTIIRGPRNPFS
jgi:hypothetical protein